MIAPPTPLPEGADDFLIEMRRGASRAVSNPRVIKFLSGLDEHIAGRSRFPAAVARAMGVAHVMRTLAREYTGFRPAAEASMLILEGLQREHDEDIRSGSATQQLLQLDTTSGAWTVGRLTDTLVGLPHADVKKLIDYIASTRLVLETLSINAYVSVETREKIAESVFTEPWEEPRHDGRAPFAE